MLIPELHKLLISLVIIQGITFKQFISKTPLGSDISLPGGTGGGKPGNCGGGIPGGRVGIPIGGRFK